MLYFWTLQKTKELFKVIGSIIEVSDTGGFLAAKQRTYSAFSRAVGALQQFLIQYANVRWEYIDLKKMYQVRSFSGNTLLG